MTVKTYDSQSYYLAAHFLQDDPCFGNPALFKERCHELALQIQQAAEDYLADDRPSQHQNSAAPERKQRT